MARILVVSPHPDDESIGCGGTLRKHVVEGDSVKVIFLTSGERGGHGRSPEETRRVREQEAKDAADILGLAQIEFWGVPNGALTNSRRLSDRLVETITEWRPGIIYVTHDREMHPEHRVAARLVRRAVAGLSPKLDKPEVLMFEVWTPLQQMDQIVDITPYVEIKMAAIRAHKSQCEVLGFDEAFLGLARYRGEMFSWPEGDYAEIFVQMRDK
jgi:LmbE family N-acetylglucosaminyl deacetylase